MKNPFPTRQRFLKLLMERESRFRFFTQGLEIEDLEKYDIEVPLSKDGHLAYTASRRPYLVITPSLPRIVRESEKEAFDRTGEVLPSQDRLYLEKPLTHTGIFGTPEKMACFSFSLPAGPVNYLGSCPASSHNTANPLFICNGCYALGGRYQMPGYILSSQIVMEWTKRLLQENRFADTMIALLQDIFEFKTEKALTLKIRKRRFKGAPLITKESWMGDTRFFRLHDSGDFFSTDYFFAWCEIAEEYPETTFWAPTRIAFRPDGRPNRANVKFLSKAPRNLVVRPSSLYFEDQPQMIDGLSAGTMSSVYEWEGVHSCPAYWNDEFDTCAEASCRACWNRPDTPVNYPVHGILAKRIYEDVYGEEEAGQIERAGKIGAVLTNFDDVEDLDADRSFLVGPRDSDLGNIHSFFRQKLEREFPPDIVNLMLDDMIDVAAGNRDGNPFENRWVQQALEEYDQGDLGEIRYPTFPERYEAR